MKITLFMLSFIFTIAVTAASAQPFDQNFEAWKTKQQQHDQRLSTNSDHYLGKPSLQSPSATQTSTIQGMVNINQAGLAELQQLSGIGAKKAQAILDYRQQHGKFKSIQELQNVKGIGPKFLEKNKARLAI